MKKKLYVAILYHQHQPLYKDPVTNYYYLPWVRLHAIKDYYDMAVWVEEIPGLRLNFNFVPSLLVQLEDYASGAMDKHLELTVKNASELTEEDKIFILKNFFDCNWPTMLYPYKRYKELLNLRGVKFVDDAELYRKTKYFSLQDWLDLQVWSNLVWFDPYWKKVDKDIQKLFEKGERFTEEDKYLLVNKQRWICGQIVKKLKQLQDQGMIEITFSAFYHPILPLLCDPSKAKISNPSVVLPKQIFQLIEDAEKQIFMAKEYYEKVFGCSPKGFWPSEGSVSDDVISLLQKYDIKWFATDEEILKRSIHSVTKKYPQREIIYRHYKIQLQNSVPVYAIFRDREISDNIGFVYYRWNYIDAVKDIETKLSKIYETVYQNHNETNDAIVSIILDGENCWEFYPNDGTEFLYELYKMLTNNELFETVLVSDFIAKHPDTDTIETIWPGSWINANYDIWIGHPEDNLAWEYVYRSRQFLISEISQKNVDEKIKELCWQEIYTAEGSDWYWWFGDEHYSAHSNIFDFLFRQHLKNIYLLLGCEPPRYLDLPIKHTKRTEYILPADFVTPKIDGRISNYFEWSSAGKYLPISSSMHQSNLVVNAIYFGFDLGNIYIRIDYNNSNIVDGLLANIIFRKKTEPQNVYYLSFPIKIGNSNYKFFSGEFSQELEYLAIDKIIEVQIPFCVLNTLPGQEIQFFITIEKIINTGKFEIERYPGSQDFFELVHPDKSYQKKFWTL
ncbi:MAG: glycoside hydrolase family 57 protein [Endomicrobia bacterium]|nr:glycoside hydrolase family 57 protein [Endomicrobiia bacterium]